MESYIQRSAKVRGAHFPSPVLYTTHSTHSDTTDVVHALLYS